MCVCVCVCVRVPKVLLARQHDAVLSAPEFSGVSGIQAAPISRCGRVCLNSRNTPFDMVSYWDI